jgi:uncharacterized protein (TIGR03435 family)
VKTLPLAAVGFAALFHPLFAAFQVTASQPAFDIASIKSTTARSPSGLRTDPGMLVAQSLSVRDLIAQAHGVSALQITGGPEWLGTLRFNVEAKADGSHGRDELLRMMQTLLADRFRLSFRREMRELMADVLVVAKSGAKLQPANGGQSMEGRDPIIKLQSAPGSERVVRMDVTGQRVTLPYLANYLSSRMNRIVVDKTGLPGDFDFKAELTADQTDAADPSISERDIMKRLFADLVQKIGLKLESQKTLVEVLVIDHIEMPTVN